MRLVAKFVGRAVKSPVKSLVNHQYLYSIAVLGGLPHFQTKPIIQENCI